ncbi:predicted protein [Sclerotinia sclerotiorum 1980 UF-70]|uniref:Uncharacterized protein n=1 Tax=Sclerotinia sclerotiorum (strain ATCC 18683 / 1980 / Ss-1) TaxID=665079 RepID=A7ED98_SCLS1|nr:predicted protein [Sclerotinia sclerotiorum 1980 UF-70]EDO00814.1 predicted protein [Sclerotinia sclerotiorum 1980 UF-70]
MLVIDARERIGIVGFRDFECINDGLREEWEKGLEGETWNSDRWRNERIRIRGGARYWSVDFDSGALKF